MGTADLVPGISGGTVALLGGIYARLLRAIGNFDTVFIKQVFKRDFYKAWLHVDGLFLSHLGIGMLLAIFLLSKAISGLLVSYPLIMWSLFLGLIAMASLLLVKELYATRQMAKTWLGVGVLVSIGLSSAPVLSAVEEFSGFGYLWLMAAGAIAISAMILPGISGSFILLMLGIYPFVLASVAALDMQVIVIFGAGCGLGLLLFSRLISYLLNRYTANVMSLLAGLMMGSAVKLWPWKHTVTYRLNSAGLEVPLQQENLMPWAYTQMTGIDNQLFVCVFVAVMGAILVSKFGRVQLNNLAKPV